MRPIFTTLALGLIIGVSMPAKAQISFGDKGAPILINAEKATYKGNMTLLQGKVDVRQGGARIQSDEMEIYREKTSGDSDAVSLGAVTRIVATGNFNYKTKENDVSGNKGVYTRGNETIVVTGNVFVKQPNGSKLRGEKMVYDLANERVKFGDQCQGDGCGDSRVRIRIENK